MIHRIFAIRDTKAEVYSQPLLMVSRGQAMRSFTDAVNDGKSEYWKHPGDYNLVELGVYDDGSGSIVVHPDGLVVLANGLTLKEDK